MVRCPRGNVFTLLGKVGDKVSKPSSFSITTHIAMVTTRSLMRH